jgi:hypothetical protein
MHRWNMADIKRCRLAVFLSYFRYFPDIFVFSCPKGSSIEHRSDRFEATIIAVMTVDQCLIAQ